MKKNQKAKVAMTKGKNMLNIYSRLLDSMPSFPSFAIFDNLEDDSDYLCKKLSNGNNTLHIKDASDDKIVSIISDKQNIKNCNVYPALPFEDHIYTDNEVSKWINIACCLSRMFNVECPQIVFVNIEVSMASGEEGILFVGNSRDDSETLVLMVHEFRHLWQHKYNNEIFDEYIQPEDDYEGYLFNDAEIDAEAFARRFAGIVYHIPLSKKKELYYDEIPELAEAYYETAMNTNVNVFIKRNKNFFTIRKLLTGKDR